MKPAPFRYFDPASVDDALSLLAKCGDEARLLAGGQTLGPMLNLRLVSPQTVIDVNRITALDYRRPSSGGITIGALTRQATLEDDSTFASRQPLVATAIPFIAHRAIRNRGTVGGSLAHADPAAEWGGLALALNASLTLRKHGGAERVIAAKDFFLGLLTTAIEPDEMLIQISLPAWPAGAGWSFLEFSRRHGDYAIAGIACVLSLGPDVVDEVRLAAFGVEETPRRLAAAEGVLRGEPFSSALAEEAARRAADDVQPMDDRQGSADYRRQLVNVLVERALQEAAGRHDRNLH